MSKPQPLQSELETALLAVLGDLQQATGDLALALQSEREALIGADAPALDRAGALKQRLMERLEQLDAERVQLSRLAPEVAARLEAQWQQVLRTLRTCHELNQRNGSLVTQRLAQVRQALATLSGQAGEAQAVYGPAGEVRAPLRSHRLASA